MSVTVGWHPFGHGFVCPAKMTGVVRAKSPMEHMMKKHLFGTFSPHSTKSQTQAANRTDRTEFVKGIAG